MEFYLCHSGSHGGNLRELKRIAIPSISFIPYRQAKLILVLYSEYVQKMAFLRRWRFYSIMLRSMQMNVDKLSCTSREELIGQHVALGMHIIHILRSWKHMETLLILPRFTHWNRNNNLHGNSWAILSELCRKKSLFLIKWAFLPGCFSASKKVTFI